MIKVLDKVEEIVKKHTKVGIVGWFKDYQPERYPSHCLEPISQSITREFVGSVINSPSFKIYYIENFINSDYNSSSRGFFERSEKLIYDLKRNSTLGGLVSQFDLKIKYDVRKVKSGKENICEILVDIDEIL